MVQLKDYLNVRYSTRNLTDEKFEEILPDLAKQLLEVSFYPEYSESILKKDWKKLCQWSSTNSYINSTSRLGIKLCEHFFPNFYEIENNLGKSFINQWTVKNLEKVLRVNRKNHSTPYLSELKRGIYFSCGLTKNTMFRPQMAKLLCIKYCPKIVLDPCAGWGGRLLGVVSTGANYIGFEPNTKTYNNLIKLVNFLNIQDKVTLICDDALNMEKYNLPKVDMILTSPPYFDVEIYCNEITQSIHKNDTYDMWVDNFLNPLIEKSIKHLNDKSVSCWNVGKVKSKNMFHDVNKSHNIMGYKKIDELLVISSKRPMFQNNIKKSSDITEVYIK
jgi:16S rRNA G966 N2-methylase RsmD